MGCVGAQTWTTIRGMLVAGAAPRQIKRQGPHKADASQEKGKKQVSKHSKWEADEVLERITAEFDDGLADLDELLAANRQALADFCRMIAA